ncbi:MAG: hypothetical protein H6577_11950 [Lewinellaceae bacterium]|nr:hypothetical protein [Lewinellaceae bacterium]
MKAKETDPTASPMVHSIEPILEIPPENKKEKKEKKKEKKKRKDREEGPGRTDKGIETMFRISSANNQRLSDMADTKAHIMISVNSIIISILISLLLRKIEDYAQFIIPAILLLGISLVTIIFSVLATRPNIPKGTFTEEDIEKKKVNLLFFGNYYKMDFERYAAGMWQVMDDREFLYGTLIKDVYAQGLVLGKKFTLLKTSYNVFMYGLIVSVLAFAVAAVIMVM